VKAASVVVTAQRRGRVKRHTVVVHRMVVQMAVEAAVPTEMVALALVVVAIVAAEIVDMSLGVVVGSILAVVVAAIAVVEVASVVDTGGEVVHFVATVEMTPRRYAVAIVAVAVLGQVEVASCVPLKTLHTTLSIEMCL
jgi:hypothetical protein